MSIKSDNWIRRMAREHRLIEPFEPSQVRSSANGRLISYGTSSYGYDVRCAPEFKIFTNINSTIVDPKHFDEKSFVDMSGDVCIIPPNSFALARTVEYFRIPRNVLTICLGKCVTGDTRVVDAETGAYVPITEMRWGKSTLSMDNWHLRPAKVSDFIPQGVRAVFQLRTRAGLSIRATANHPFRTLTGWIPLSELRAGDRIAIAREIPVFGKTPLPDWEATLLGLMISEGQCSTPGHSPTYTGADPALVKLLEETIQQSGFGTVTSKGRYGYRLVNHANRGGIPERNRAAAWLERRGLDVLAGDKLVPQCVFTAPEPSVRLFLQALFSGDGGAYSSAGGHFLEYYSKSQRLIEDVHHLLLRFGVFSLIRNKLTAIGTPAWNIQITDKEQIARFAERIGFVPGSIKHRRLTEQMLPSIRLKPRCRSDFDTLPREPWAMLQTAARVGGYSLNALQVQKDATQSVPMAAVRPVSLMTGDLYVSPLSDGPIWDVVESIAPAGEEEVYDITVPKLHNFVANGLIVHNSTYARCFRGDTRVALVDGTTATLEQMAHRHELGELFWGYSVGAHGRVIVTLLDQPRFIGRDALIEITLDNGETIQATPDHSFLKRDGISVLASELRSGDALMPLYRDLRRGYEYVYQPLNGHLLAAHRLSDDWNIRNGIYTADPGTHRHHIDLDRRNNRPTNLAHDAHRQATLRRYEHPLERIRHAEALRIACANSDGSRRKQLQAAAPRNHKVVAIRDLPGDHDVYCLTVPEAGNFALEAGVFVHNCGIIVNVTPLEPEWEGHVTLEFSNTTPLPAKIYANEGVAQMLFFESDEVCSTSYADRGGKYQGQKGVTLPKT
jgi:deoxycytidine triphosphate deaminase